MKCSDVQEWLGVYWDLPEGDERRRAIDEHIGHCEACREEFRIWRESAQLIRDSAGGTELPPSYEPVSRQVMKRIYADETWRIPVPERMYAISYRMRRNLTAVIAFCLTLFIFGFVFSIVYGDSDSNTLSDSAPKYGLKPVASVRGDVKTVSSKSGVSFWMATASLKDPHMVKMGPIRTVPDYMVVLSLLGMIATILIMNWLSRTKA